MADGVSLRIMFSLDDLLSGNLPQTNNLYTVETDETPFSINIGDIPTLTLNGGYEFLGYKLNNNLYTKEELSQYVFYSYQGNYNPQIGEYSFEVMLTTKYIDGIKYVDSKGLRRFWEKVYALVATLAGNLQNQITQINSKDSQQDTAITALQADSTVTALSTRVTAIEGNVTAIEGNITAINTKLQSQTIETTLVATNWQGTQAPFTYALSVEGVTTTSNQDITFSVNATQAQIESCQSANIVTGGQSTGVINLRAFGSKPTVDIPIIVVKRGIK